MAKAGTGGFETTASCALLSSASITHGASYNNEPPAAAVGTPSLRAASAAAADAVSAEGEVAKDWCAAVIGPCAAGIGPPSCLAFNLASSLAAIMRAFAPGSNDSDLYSFVRPLSRSLSKSLSRSRSLGLCPLECLSLSLSSHSSRSLSRTPAGMSACCGAADCCGAASSASSPSSVKASLALPCLRTGPPRSALSSSYSLRRGGGLRLRSL
mmetsp:Transcript_45451/g.66671  ORF Transcript_45451/g.66671 Transcript_45451/m.66671 type:complete len:212 (-) Transcript_45451:41-676(-)